MWVPLLLIGAYVVLWLPGLIRPGWALSFTARGRAALGITLLVWGARNYMSLDVLSKEVEGGQALATFNALGKMSAGGVLLIPWVSLLGARILLAFLVGWVGYNLYQAGVAATGPNGVLSGLPFLIGGAVRGALALFVYIFCVRQSSPPAA